MLAPAEMSEVDVFVFDSDIEAVAQAVARLGVMHLLNASSLGKWSEGVGTEWTGRTSAYTTQERRVKELLSQLRIEGDPPTHQGPLNPAEDLKAVEEELLEIEASVRALREGETSLTRDIERLQLVSKSMEMLEPLSVSISDLRQLEHLHLVLGTIPYENLARLETSLFRIPYTIVPVYRYLGRVLVFAFCAVEHAAILERALDSAFLDPLSLPEEYGGTAQEVLDQISNRLEQAHSQLTDTIERRAALAQELGPSMLSMLARVRAGRAIAGAMSHFGHRGRIYLIAGWVPKYRVEELRTAVEQVAEGRVTFDENPPGTTSDRHKVPTLLRNSKLFQPVEGLVTIYGVPGYQEINPTPLLGITFVLMFGMMFGDLGQGLVLAAIGGLLALRVMPQLAGQAQTGVVILACGLSSGVFGLLYGSVFGMEELIPALWLSPMHDILTLLGVSVAFGVILLNIGFAYRLATALRIGRIGEAIFDRNGGVGLLFYWCLMSLVGFVAMGGGVPGWLAMALTVLALALFLAEPLTNLVTGARPILHGSAFEMLVQAFFELFETLLGYVSNTLSYVRLGAFAMAHAGLSSVVLLLADMAGSGPTGGGLRLLILVMGNLVIIGFEGLIVGIQTLRLEYYELFGKFFKGDGVRFKPLTLPEMETQRVG